MRVAMTVCRQRGSGKSPEHTTGWHATEFDDEVSRLKLTNTTCSRTGDVGEWRPPMTTKLEFPYAGFPGGATSGSVTVAWHMRNSKRSLSTVYVSADIVDRFQLVTSGSRWCRPDGATPKPPTAATVCRPFTNSLLMVWPNRWQPVSVSATEPTDVNSAAVQYEPFLHEVATESESWGSTSGKIRDWLGSMLFALVPSDEDRPPTSSPLHGINGCVLSGSDKWQESLFTHRNVPQSVSELRQLLEFGPQLSASERRGHRDDRSSRQEPWNAVTRT